MALNPLDLPETLFGKGGAGSGNFGHEGRPGERGGSGPGGGPSGDGGGLQSRLSSLAIGAKTELPPFNWGDPKFGAAKVSGWSARFMGTNAKGTRMYEVLDDTGRRLPQNVSESKLTGMIERYKSEEDSVIDFKFRFEALNGLIVAKRHYANGRYEEAALTLEKDLGPNRSDCLALARDLRAAMAAAFEKEQIQKYIKEENGKFCVYSEAGKKLGEHDTKAAALAQLRAIEANKSEVSSSYDVAKLAADLDVERPGWRRKR